MVVRRTRNDRADEWGPAFEDYCTEESVRRQKPMKVDTDQFRVREGDKVDLAKWQTRVKPLFEEKAEYLDYLKKQVGELKHKIDEGERTATTLVARKNAAMAQQKVSEALAGVGKADNAFATLASFEQSVTKQEATAKAFGELASAGKDDGLEAEFAQLGGGSVNAELEEMKRQRALPKVEFQRELPPAPGY